MCGYMYVDAMQPIQERFQACRIKGRLGSTVWKMLGEHCRCLLLAILDGFKLELPLCERRGCCTFMADSRTVDRAKETFTSLAAWCSVRECSS